MEKEDANAVNAGFEQLMAESFALKRLLAMLFAESPGAMKRLTALSEQDRRDLLMNSSLSDAFIDRALETMRAVQRIAEVTLGQRQPGDPA